MGYNARNDEIHENLERMHRERETHEDSLAIVRQFNARLSAKKTAWFWPTIAAALESKHHWLIIACDACGTVIDLDLTMKRRDPDAPIRVALNDVRCPRCKWAWPDADHRCVLLSISLTDSPYAQQNAGWITLSWDSSKLDSGQER